MPRNDEGEFELVLGNRQLLSVFFIIIILMGVCLTMGYVLGRNAGVQGVASAPKPSTIVVDPTVPEPAQSVSAAMQPGEVQVQAPASAVSAPPAGTAPPPVETASGGPIIAPPPLAETKPPVTSQPPPPVKPVEPGGIEEPAPGQTFLQVAAARRQDAEVLAEELRKKNFPARIAPGPQGLVRVLVGPIDDSGERVKTRVRLKDEAGLDSFVKTYR